MRKRKQRQSANGGFTLIELLVVMVIIAILAAAVVPRVVGHTEDAKRARAVADITNLGTALDMYYAHNSMYPTTEQGLEALLQAPSSEPAPKAWSGPYLKTGLPRDPWGSLYVYTYPGEHNPSAYDLVSYGVDGQPGGVGNDADIGNWEEDNASYR